MYSVLSASTRSKIVENVLLLICFKVCGVLQTAHIVQTDNSIKHDFFMSNFDDWNGRLRHYD
jgi:hypothetical protein